MRWSPGALTVNSASAPTSAGENAFTYGLLYEREDQRAVRLRAKARQAWKRTPRPRLRH